MSVLELPEEEQKAIAKEAGFDDLEAWREYVRETLEGDEDEIIKAETAGDLLNDKPSEEEPSATEELDPPIVATMPKE